MCYLKLPNDLAQLEEIFGDNFMTVIAGDFNARTGKVPDFIDIDECRYVPVDENYISDEKIAPRVSQDLKPANESGHALIDFCKSTGYRILNGRLGKDAKSGSYTCCTPNGCSVVDYMLCRNVDFCSITDFAIEDHTLYSDHNVVHLEFNCGIPALVGERHTDGITLHKLRWKKNNCDTFVQDLNSEHIVDMFEKNLKSKKWLKRRGR